MVTGELSKYSRNEIEDKLKLQGADIQSQISKKTDILIVGNNPGSKYNKALQFGTKIILEDELYSLIF